MPACHPKSSPVRFSFWGSSLADSSFLPHFVPKEISGDLDIVRDKITFALPEEVKDKGGEPGQDPGDK